MSTTLFQASIVTTIMYSSVVNLLIALWSGSVAVCWIYPVYKLVDKMRVPIKLWVRISSVQLAGKAKCEADFMKRITWYTINIYFYFQCELTAV